MSNEHHIALCSGGTDSMAAAHVAMTAGDAEKVVFIDTGTGPDDDLSAIKSQIGHLSMWCGDNNWPFEVIETPNNFSDWVNEQGYPGPGLHWIAYNKLKDRAIQTYNRDIDGELHCHTGIRTAESDRRAEFDEEDDERGNGRWYWHRPIIDWSDADVQEYLDAQGIEPSPIVQELGRSADCWCGCFGDRNELIDLQAAGFVDHAEWLREIETPDNCPREQDVWAGYNWEKSDFAQDDNKQMMLCSSCDRNKEPPDWDNND